MKTETALKKLMSVLEEREREPYIHTHGHWVAGMLNSVLSAIF